MKEHRKDIKGNPLPTCWCNTCGHELNSASPFDEKEPQPGPGDVSVCAYCGVIYAFKEDMTIRDVELNDILQLTDKERDIIGKMQAEAMKRRGYAR